MRDQRTVKVQSALPRRSGFTLYEVIIVLVIAAVLGAVAYPRLDLSHYRADSVVQNVRSALAQAQRYALKQQHDVIVSFDTVGGVIKIGMDANNDNLITSGELIYTKVLETGNKFKKGPSGGVNGSVTKSIVGSNLGVQNGNPTVTYHRDGSLSSDLEIYLSAPGKGTAFAYRAILVVMATGRTDWYRWSTESNKWLGAAL